LAAKLATSNLVLRALPVISGNPGTVDEFVDKSNKLMEVFGGAYLSDGNKSSRFGRYTIVHFDGNGKIQEIQLTTHLFEKIRLVTRAPNESNFLVFYQLVIGSLDEEKEDLGILPLNEYRYLSGLVPECFPEDLEKSREWMSQLGLNLVEITTIFEITAAILLIGNISFFSQSNGVKISNLESNSLPFFIFRFRFSFFVFIFAFFPHFPFSLLPLFFASDPQLFKKFVSSLKFLQKALLML